MTIEITHNGHRHTTVTLTGHHDNLTVDANGKVTRYGLADPNGVTVVAETKSTIAIKIPGHKHWVGLGYQGYASPELIVYAKSTEENSGTDRTINAAFITRINMGRKAKS